MFESTPGNLFYFELNLVDIFLILLGVFLKIFFNG